MGDVTFQHGELVRCSPGVDCRTLHTAFFAGDQRMIRCCGSLRNGTVFAEKICCAVPHSDALAFVDPFDLLFDAFHHIADHKILGLHHNALRRAECVRQGFRLSEVQSLAVG